MKENSFILLLAIILSIAGLFSCSHDYPHKVVICIPVYGQSLALGEEATRITDFDSLSAYADGRIVSEKLDHDFGYFDTNDLKQFIKQIVHSRKRSFELSVYSMAETLADSTGQDTIICIFPGGRGTTDIAHLVKGSKPYQRLTDDIQKAYSIAQERGWDFVMPALCWMQGESDITDYPDTDFRQLFLQFTHDLNDDVIHITGQQQSIEIISYQPNPVTRASNFNPLAYDCPEMLVANTLLEMVRDNPAIHPSGPTYPYSFAREAIHIDAIGQQLNGQFAALAALDILRHQHNLRGLLPTKVSCSGNEVIISMSIPSPPLTFDTLSVTKVPHYGFSVITPMNQDIAEDVYIQDDTIHILCRENPGNSRVRYAVNGEKGKSGHIHGPRGNLRDSQGNSLSKMIQGHSFPLHNWCWQFDIPVK